MGNMLSAVGAGAAVIAFVIIAWVVALGLAVLAVFMLIWNITDIQNVGANFWNVTWIILAALYLLGLVASIFKRG